MKICPTCNQEFQGRAEYCPHDGSLLVPVPKGTGTVMLYDRLIGSIVDNRYKIEARLGEGALAVVYAATHLAIEKRVALKVLKPEFHKDPEIVERFLREARAASRLTHANIVSISDFGRTGDGTPFFAMELLDGPTLADQLSDARPLPVARAVSIARGIGFGLAAAHRNGVIHRDLKPENVILTRTPEGEERVKVLDFGLAKITQSRFRITRDGQVLGTPEYMAPEQAVGGEVDHRADVYSLGVLLYQMLTGKVPFSGPSAMAVLGRMISESPLPPGQLRPDGTVSEAVQRVVLRALSREPSDRYASMEELVDDLTQAANTTPGTGALPTEPTSAELAACPMKSNLVPGNLIDDEMGDAADAVRRIRWSHERTRWMLLGALFAMAVIGGGIIAAVWIGARPRSQRPAPQPGPRNHPPTLPSDGPQSPAPADGVHPAGEAEPGARLNGNLGPRESSKATVVWVSFESNPADAMVTIEGRPMGRTPIRVELRRESREIVAAFEKTGYRKRELKFRPTRAQTVRVSLAVLPSPGVGRPAAASSGRPPSGPSGISPEATQSRSTDTTSLGELKNPFTSAPQRR